MAPGVGDGVGVGTNGFAGAATPSGWSTCPTSGVGWGAGVKVAVGIGVGVGWSDVGVGAGPWFTLRFGAKNSA